MLLKRTTTLLACLVAAILLALDASSSLIFAEDGNVMSLGELHIELAEPLCGQSARDVAPRLLIEEYYAAQQGDQNLWVSWYDESNPAVNTAFEEGFVGGEQYRALVTIEALPGYCFTDETSLLALGDGSHVEAGPLRLGSTRLVAVIAITAEHDWDWEQSVDNAASCVGEGQHHLVCRADASHVEDATLPVDPNAHAWGEWTVTKEPGETQAGERQHTCSLCGAVETQELPAETLAYATVYEPNTSWPMAATVAWRADASALEVAQASERPSTVFVWLDANLWVYDREGRFLSSDIDGYITATSTRVIPAFYIKDAETATALKQWLEGRGLLDCFVVSTPENKALVKDVADLLHVRGMLDYTALSSPDRASLIDMVASVNEAHGKVVLISSEAATRENVQLLQRLASTVWVQTPTDTKTLLTHYTNGVNGVVVDDYQAALAKEELFQDDAPSMLRVPLVIGHRGDPSTYVENTLDSARGAYEGGADAVECDVRLSADGELFIFHDEYASTFMGVGSSEGADQVPVESLTLGELRSHPFLWSELAEHNEVFAARSRYGALVGQDEQREYVVPTLREYLEAFKDTDLVHDIEIKSTNAQVIGAIEELVDEYDAWDQVFTITFNTPILDAIYREHPELSVGALGPGNGVNYPDFDQLVASEGTEAALRELFGVVDQWNASYNPCNPYNSELVRAARHRGLTVWPWTYYTPGEDFAKAYLSGVAGLTYDWPWTTSDLIVEIEAQDLGLSFAQDVPKPTGITQAGERRLLENAEPILLERISDTQTLAIWRYRADLVLRDTSYGSYYLYSNPFVITVA